MTAPSGSKMHADEVEIDETLVRRLLGEQFPDFESIGRTGWLSLMVFIPTFGALVAAIWTAVEMPARHDRSRWWTLGLLLPGVNLVAYWFYAFTLPRQEFSFA